ncbi:LysM domain protein [Rickettsiales bacterium Ac37b]|nr:LysM domain protein [Rickettsiales bacterium Ac37b]
MPTIGAGFALINKVKEGWEAWDKNDLKDLGINLTNEQHKIITDYADAKSNHKSTKHLKQELDKLDFSITPKTAENLLRSSIEDKYKHIKTTLGEEHWNKLNLAQQIGVMDHCFHRGNVFAIKQALINGDYQKAADIMRKTNHDSLKARAELRASFVEEGKMQFDNIHLVKPGETLKAIADSHGLSLEAIKKLNPKLRNPDKLSIGAKINLKSKENAEEVTKANKAEKVSMIDIMEKYANLKEEEKARLQQEFNIEGEKLQEAFLASFKEWKEKLLDIQEKETSAKVTSLQAAADSECTARENVLKNTPCTAANGVLTSVRCSTPDFFGRQDCIHHYECTIKVDCDDIYNKYQNLLSEHKASQKLLAAKQISEKFDQESDFLDHNTETLKNEYNDRLAAIIDELTAEKYAEIIAANSYYRESYFEHV